MTAEQLASNALMCERYPNSRERLKEARRALKGLAKSGYLVEAMPGLYFATELGAEPSAALNAALADDDCEDFSTFAKDGRTAEESRDDGRRRELAGGVWGRVV